MALWYGVDDLVSSEGVDEVNTQLSIAVRSEETADLAQAQPGSMSEFGRSVGFGGLPVTTQLVYRVLVTIPVGITILVFLRQFIGVQTVGTFMPVLIGIAFRETALINGLLLFSLLIALGLVLRFLLERLQLLLVPRLAVVLIFIVVAMAAITTMMGANNQSIGLSISLFPMVIIAMTIERMSVIWEESSAGEAIKQGIGSLAVASISYLVMINAYIEHLMYQFPELIARAHGAEYFDGPLYWLAFV